ncbi:MAG: hypothetical protein CVU55_01360 [Deltaproteobacteria bacterium HGW-Deltaproteobacteria-13]|jgi:hypothetical protein|nr:MAG: hypothetical protein CVU55_01360 [Deltaproteobacteria bacterium HGW-Deltaproteobacteria-13]
MRHGVCKVMGMVLLAAMAILCQSCTDAKCKLDQTKCTFNCPSTIGMKQACEQKCNLLYDICRNQK